MEPVVTQAKLVVADDAINIVHRIADLRFIIGALLNIAQAQTSENVMARHCTPLKSFQN